MTGRDAAASHWSPRALRAGGLSEATQASLTSSIQPQQALPENSQRAV
jgi:hypothetical protein